jgi:hypothetical protein
MKKRDVLVSAAIIAIALGSTLALMQRKGRIAFSTPGAQLQLQGLLFGMTLASSQQPIEVPARTYTVRRLVLTANQDGQVWQMTSQNPWGRIKVQPGTTTAVKQCGPPFEIVPQISIHRGIANVDFSIIGQGGERYSKVVTKNGKLVPAPRVEILDEQGRTLASGQFEYG